MTSNIVRAIIWDYDGTLADTRQRNLNVTKKIIRKISGRSAEDFSSLDNIDSYYLANKRTTNWRDLYRSEFGFTEEETDEAGKVWTEYQLRDETFVPFFNGIEEVFENTKDIPHGIVSQNSRSIITSRLSENKLGNYIKCVIGYEEVDLKKQKPEPSGLLMCIDKLSNSNPGYVFYIGDHETDTECVKNANRVIKEKNIDLKVLSIAALYGAETSTDNWRYTPDYEVKNAKDILNIICKI